MGSVCGSLQLRGEGPILLALESVAWLPQTSICQDKERDFYLSLYRKEALEKKAPFSTQKEY